eukprot:gnl/TRDRNA2_/TRDRNA2_171896_c5_seq1.p1 gnl/TRDRNA2_/TRDRNA2_171896_c5~~gnl/TRDRNA2_/TRDRNA2_171896_c5_seq1.p1  ORF type:complete len:250 (+),score=34.73 gnl/TRDRNA2_/TRDRNA2_171896_c5_seq1:337-1086(+)
MCTTACVIYGIKYDHYFVTDGTWTVEFGNAGFTSNSLLVYATMHKDLVIDKQFNMDEEVKERMKNVCGATNYSFGLRNSEHVARYIHCGTWCSLQMTGDSRLCKALDGALGDKRVLAHTLPHELQTKSAGVSSSPIYHHWKPPFQVRFEKQRSTLAPGADDINMLVLGPTGAGKSSIINLLFNQRVAKAKASALSVTRQMSIYSGTFYSPEARRTYNLNVIDSVGFCDSERVELAAWQCVSESGGVAHE